MVDFFWSSIVNGGICPYACVIYIYIYIIHTVYRLYIYIYIYTCMCIGLCMYVCFYLSIRSPIYSICFGIFILTPGQLKPGDQRWDVRDVHGWNYETQRWKVWRMSSGECFFWQPPKRYPGVFKLEPLEHVGTLENMGKTPYHPGNTVLSVWGGAAKIHMNHPTYLPSFIAKPWSGRLMHYSAGENQKTYVLVRTRLQQLFFTQRTDIWTAAKRFVMQSGTYSFFLRKSFPKKTYIHSLLHFCFLALRASVQLKSKHVCPFGLHTWKEKLAKHNEACFVFGQDRCFRKTVASVCMFFSQHEVHKFVSDLVQNYCSTPLNFELCFFEYCFGNHMFSSIFILMHLKKRLMSPPGTEVFEATSPDWFHCVPDLDRPGSPRHGLKCPCCFWIFHNVRPPSHKLVYKPQ